MRILWVSNAPWSPTGYGVQTQTFIWRLQKAGHEITMLAFYGLQGAPLNADGIRILPCGFDAYGNDVIQADAEAVKADIVISLMDVWVLNPMVMHTVKWYPWLPVDHDPVPPGVAASLRVAQRPICYSQFGVRKLKEAGFDPLYVPHGVDTKLYHPVERSLARQALGCPPDVFMVGIVAANKGAPSRKAFDQQIRAFAEFRKRHPDALLYLHTDMSGRQGENIHQLLHLNDVPARAVATVGAYSYARGVLGTDYMSNAYSAMDVCLNAVKGGGFELCLIEAQACGTPVITTNFSAMPELVRSGWLVEAADQFYSQESYEAVPSVPGIIEALEKAYTARNDQALREKARAAMVAEYDADHIVEVYWKPVLETIQAAIKTPDTPVQLDLANNAAIRKAQRLALRNGCAGGHDWSPVGLYDTDGALCFPCRRSKCEVERRIIDGHETISPTGFSTTIDGIKLDIEDDPQGGVAKIICREIDRNYDLNIPFVDGDVVLDIGAQVGIVSIALAKKHPAIKIYAFEPVPENFNRLVRNLQANDVQNVIAVNKAVSVDGAELVLHGDPSTNSGGFSAYTRGNGQSYRVPSLTLAQIFEDYNLRRVKLIKIDVEGAEYDILGAAGDLLRRVEFLRGEFHTNSRLATNGGGDPEDLINKIAQWIPRDHIKVTICRIAD